MKKIVGIIAALALVAGTAFADEPSVTPKVATFSGNASIEYDIDLDNTKFGIANADSADFEIQFVAKGDKTTVDKEGDGQLWGELKIKVGDDVKAKGTNGAEVDAFKFKGATVDTAKIHFTDDDDFYVNMNIKAPGLEIGGGDIITATWSAKAFPKASVSLDNKAGFTLNFGRKDLIDMNFQFADNGVQKSSDKKFAFVFDASLKAVKDLTFVAGAGFSTQENQFAAAVKADYKLGLTDVLYLKPAVGFALAADKSKTLNGGFLLGWGKEGQEPKFAKFKGAEGNWDNIPDKCADGFSVFAGVPLAEGADIELLVGAFDSTLVSGLKLGAELYAPSVKNFGDKFVADVAAAYSTTVAENWKISANFGLEAEKIASVSKDLKLGFLWGCGVENGAIIDNTTLYVNYAGQAAKDIQKLDGSVKGTDEKGTIKIGAKISF